MTLINFGWLVIDGLWYPKVKGFRVFLFPKPLHPYCWKTQYKFVLDLVKYK